MTLVSFSIATFLLLCQTVTVFASEISHFAKITPARKVILPAFHQLQPEFQTQWWYVTANLVGEDNQHYGAQFTLFSHGFDVSGQPQSLHFAHAALSSKNDYFFAERYSRDDMHLGGQSDNPWRVFIDHWQFRGSGNAPLPGVITVSQPSFGYRLELSQSPYLLQGVDGYSRKNAKGTLASYYYSAPFIAVTGEITLNGKSLKVKGHAWYDRELSSSMFSNNANQLPNQAAVGWDWLSLHLNQDQALMLYRVRHEGESYLQGTLLHRDGSKIALTAEQIDWQPIHYQRLGTHNYPVSWRLRIVQQHIDITIEPLNAKQWFNGTIAYWEGAVFTSGSHQAWGYLELFGH